MVLSNKKLKQKLREKLLSLTETQTNSNLFAETVPTSSSSTSLKLLLDSSSHKPILSKREKRRKLRPLQKQPSQNDDGGTNNKEINATEDGSDKKKKKKRKRKVEIQNNDAAADDVTNDAVVKDINQPEKKKKQKLNKKKQQKEKQKAKTAEEENGTNHEAAMAEKKKNSKMAEVNGSYYEAEMPEATVSRLTKTNNITSQENGYVPTKVYVGGIPYYSTEDDIRSYFEGCGTITEVDCMFFPESGKFRGIAFINFKTEAAAKRALALDGSDMGGLFLKIQPYKATQAARFAPEVIDGYNRIYAGNLSWEITEEELKKFFSDCSIKSIRFGMDKETGEFRGYAHVDFNDTQSLKTALTLDQSVLFGRPVRISCAVPLKKKPSAGEKPDVGKKLDAGKKPDAGEKPDVGKKPDAEEKPDAGEKPAEKPTLPVNSKMKNRRCYGCHQKGHNLSECPNKETDASTTI